MLFYRQVLMVPYGPLGQAIRQQIIWDCHDCTLSCHKGVLKTIHTIKNRATWEGLTVDVEHYVQSCTACQQAKRSTLLPVGHLYPIPPPSTPWQSCSVDWLSNLTPSRGGKDAI